MKNTVLKTNNISIVFGGLHAVEDFSIEIKEGELVGLIGPNGAGKTTVFNRLTCVYKPTTGNFFLDGVKLNGKTPVEINKAGIARTFQNIRLFKNLTVLDNVKLGLHNQVKYSTMEGIFRLPRFFSSEKKMDKKAMVLLEVFGLENEASTLADNLPYGKQRKLEIARALATNPKLLLLDEPAAGMNPSETQELMDTIRFVRDNFDMTILLIEHDMKFVSGLCDEVTVLNFGTVLAQGTAQEALNDPEVIKAYIGE
jgi:branched-chain amino acid transport system ATP-binding protein